MGTTPSSQGDSSRRFSDRVENYVRYRPGYPAEIVEALRHAGALHADSIVADLGSGTGLLTRLFLHAGYKTFGIEPNAPMRAAGEEFLRMYPHFVSLDGTAEATTLPEASVDLVVAGQAFHWFDRAAAKREFLRILRPSAAGGWVALIWNDRQTEATTFLKAYEQVLAMYSTDYAKVDHKQLTPEILGEFFAPHGYELLTFPNRQTFDFEGLRGRLLSSSYAPLAGHPDHEPMLRELRRVFEMHQQNGQVVFEYVTEVHVGRVRD